MWLDGDSSKETWLPERIREDFFDVWAPYKYLFGQYYDGEGLASQGNKFLRVDLAKVTPPFDESFYLKSPYKVW